MTTDLLWRQLSWPQRRSLNDLQSGCGSRTWSEFSTAGCFGCLKSKTSLLGELVFCCEELFVRVGAVEMKQTSQLCRTVLATLSPFSWIRNRLEKGRKNNQERRTSSGVSVKTITLLNLQIRSQKQRLQGCPWFCKGRCNDTTALSRWDLC